MKKIESIAILSKNGLKITASWINNLIVNVDVESCYQEDNLIEIYGNPDKNELDWFIDYLDKKFYVWEFPRVKHINKNSEKILDTLIKVPAGETLSYKDLGSIALKSSNYARVVGNLMGKNSLPLIIPCHRVIKSDGGLGGFSLKGGLELKIKLLEHES